MISLVIEPIAKEPKDLQSFVYGWNGTLTININETKTVFHLGGKGEPYKWCVGQAQAILYGISTECKSFADGLENKINGGKVT